MITSIVIFAVASGWGASAVDSWYHGDRRTFILSVIMMVIFLVMFGMHLAR